MVMDAFETFEVGEHHVVEFFVFHISFVFFISGDVNFFFLSFQL